MLRTYKKLWDLLLSRERKQAIFLLLLMIVFGAIETFGIISIFPLVSVISNPQLIETNNYLNLVYQYFNFESIETFLIFLTSLVFCKPFFTPIAQLEQTNPFILISTSGSNTL